jgi:hypothetical protein
MFSLHYVTCIDIHNLIYIKQGLEVADQDGPLYERYSDGVILPHTCIISVKDPQRHEKQTNK